MCVDLTTCKRKAEELYLSENCPRKENGRKEGKMNLTIHFWNNMGYQHLNRTAQNLRDKSAHIEKTTKATASQITKEIQQQRNRRNQQQDRSAEIEEGIIYFKIQYKKKMNLLPPINMLIMQEIPKRKI